MKIFAGFAFIAALLAFPAGAQARVFSLNREKFASYLLFNYGTSKIADNTIYKEEATATAYSEDVKTNLGGEFGFIYATELISWRFGFEILKPAAINSTATNAGGTAIYDVKSDITGFLPKLGLEINLKTTPTLRVYAFGYVGQTSVTIQNDHTNVTVAPNTAFTTKYKGNCNAKGGGLAFEFSSFDTSTLVLEVGYRDMFIDKLTYSEAVTDFGGARAPGDNATWAGDGKAREIDLGGPYAALGFRFYLF